MPSPMKMRNSFSDYAYAISAKDTTAKRTSAARQKQLADGKVRVRPIVTKACLTFDEFHAQLLAGIQRRATGTSTVHDQSSRTHAVFEIETVTRELLDAKDAVVSWPGYAYPAKSATCSGLCRIQAR
ncbi:hypothetical protein CNMCM5793_008777 [Aspergillus hiratsukae]|uniref:Kinesin motor domain-containing protein n=1 Tax=Aspergillus hiratsukae TaxID=1194566 RepID=A0A8H6P0C3_9EURO|nr:hypothetical protein CNMCM5793_008777 [Aspergillus hiratsukae]KAF7157957.1 hypothetical protein CNMCM6106_004246 [Aspergillus hiratsukae]